MSIFSDIPSPFPLNVSLKSRPVTYRLQCDGAERFATVLLSLMWGLAIPAALIWIADPFAPWPGEALPIGRSAALAALLIFLWFGVRSWLWPNIRAALTRVEVRITETDVEVAARGPFGVRRWTKPVSDYLGVAIENWGTRTVGNDKIPVAAVMLVHRDDGFSVPIHIDGALRVKERVARGKAELLGLPLIDAPRFATGAKVHAPGTVVVNVVQATKVRVIHAVLGVAGLAAAAIALSGYWSHGETGNLVLAALALSTSAAIHIFAGCYVTAMTRAGTSLDIDTALPVLGRHRIDVADGTSVRYREGRGGSGTHHANHTPWVKIEIAGARLPFIVDMQSDYVDEQALIDLGGATRK